jgi:hypothetical protein
LAAVLESLLGALPLDAAALQAALAGPAEAEAALAAALPHLAQGQGQEQPLMPPLLALLPLCVQNGEPGLAFAVLEALDALVTDNPGVEVQYDITITLAPPYSLHKVLLKVESYNGTKDGLKNHVADGFTDMSVVLAGTGRFAANFRGRWLGADRRLRLPPGFADSHREGYPYVLPGAARAVHTNDGKRLAQRPRHTQGSVASSLCTTSYPFHTISVNIFGASVSEATMRPDPRHTPQLAGLVLSSYLPTTVLLG